ncbi:MAG: AzlC family ABC transporter permease [Clostridiales bacterium]|nr:AzlC family ABC transporter permease [Candidatus Equinaster intestinalis]
MDSKSKFVVGIKDGIPICLGYLSVAFAFGVFAVGNGLNVLESLLISMTNVTSAGQLSGVVVMTGGGTLFELALTQLVINLRYSLMSLSLSQKFDKGIKLLDRFVLAFVNTDEVFAVASSKEGKVSRGYMYGLIITPYFGWAFGTMLGALAGNLFPPIVISALGIAIYGMFIAIVLPAAKKERSTALCVLFAISISCLFKFWSPLKVVPEGFAIIICAVASSAIFAFIDCKRKKAQK